MLFDFGVAGPGLAAVANIDVIECASVAAELRAVAAVTRRLSETGAAVLVCAGDLVAHTEALARLHRSAGTAALTAASGSACAATGPDLRPALRLSGAGGGRQKTGRQRNGRQRSGPERSARADGTGAHVGGRRAVVAAGSAFHRVHAPDAVGCGAFLVSADDGDPLADAADELAGLAAGELTDDLLTDDPGAAGPAADPAGSPGNLIAGSAPQPAPGQVPDMTAGPPQNVTAGQPRDVMAGQPRNVAGPAQNIVAPASNIGGRPPAGRPPGDVVTHPPTDLAVSQAGDLNGSAAAVASPAGPAAHHTVDPAVGPGAEHLADPAVGLAGGRAGTPIARAAGNPAPAEPGNPIAGQPDPDAAGPDAHAIPLPRAAAPAARHGSGFTDSVALLLVGLVRSGAGVEAVDAGPLVCLRVQTTQQARAAAAELNAVAEDRVRLDGAVKRGDGLFATCFVSPYSRYIAIWAARRRLSPNAVTGMSIGLGALAAVWFSSGSRAGMILGAALLVAAFVLDCVDGQLARYLRAQTQFGAWLDAVGGRLGEFAVYAGLAAGAAVSPSPSVWELAVAAMILQSLRDMVRFCVQPISPHLAGLAAAMCLPLDEPADYAVSAPVATGQAGAKRRPRARWLRVQARRVRRLAQEGLRWLARIIEFQPGERVAVIGVTAIVAGPRVTFLVLLAWGLVSACLTIIGRIVRSLSG